MKPKVSTLSGSRGLIGAARSPDGRYIVALHVGSPSVVLFDFRTQKWSELTTVRAAFLNWSRDGQYVYFLRWVKDPAVLRIRITDRRLEQIADLANLPTTGNIGPWLGLGPDDSPLVLKDIGTQDQLSQLTGSLLAEGCFLINHAVARMGCRTGQSGFDPLAVPEKSRGGVP